MQKIINKEKLVRIIDFLEDKKDCCIYLYINLYNYVYVSDCNDENVSVFVDNIENGTSLVLLQYYSTMHIFSSQDFKSIETILNFIDFIHPQVIFCSEQLGQMIEKYLYGGYACQIYGNYCLPYKCGIYCEDVKEVCCDDLNEMVDFLLTDSTYISSYSCREELYNQLYSRMKNGTGRYFALYLDNKMVALEGTNAETGLVAITGSLLVNPAYRGQGLARKLVFGLRYILCDQEGKTVYGLVENQSVIRMLLDLNANRVCNIYKFHIK